MSDRTKEQIQFLASKLARTEGELWATQLALRALILSHGDVTAAMGAVALQIERAIASGLPAGIDDQFLEGLEYGRQKVLPSQRDLDELFPK
jgi:hypothetical protein